MSTIEYSTVSKFSSKQYNMKPRKTGYGPISEHKKRYMIQYNIKT